MAEKISSIDISYIDKKIILHREKEEKVITLSGEEVFLYVLIDLREGELVDIFTDNNKAQKEALDKGKVLIGTERVEFPEISGKYEIKVSDNSEITIVQKTTLNEK